MKNRVTISDIAKYCNCSTATITRVIRNSGYVSADKRAQIEEAIVKFGYVPKQNVKCMPLPDARIIALFNQNSVQPLFGMLADGISQEAMKHGYYVITLHVDRTKSATEIVKMIDALRQYNISGIIFNSLGDVIDFMAIRRYLQTLPLPVVMVERVADIYNINKVLINSQESMFLAVQCLCAAGHKNIVLFNSNEETKVETSRLEGFKNATRNFDIEDNCSIVHTKDYSAEVAYDAIAEYLMDHELPTAIVAADSMMAGILQYFRKYNIRVPEDVSLVGLDDTYSFFLSPQLTTVAFPVFEMCQLAVEVILSSMQHKGDYSSREVILSPFLVKRDSVAAPRKQKISLVKHNISD